MESTEIYSSMIQPRSPGYNRVIPASHYRDPIDHSPGRLAGNSRRAGDASPEVQSRAIDALIASSERAGLTPREIAYVLAIARAESGFNPDAAAGTTTAYGLGQFVNGTGRGYGINSSNRDDLRLQADALVAHYQDNAALARRRGQGDEYIYKYHHDGPNKESGGLDLFRKKIAPYLDQYEQFVRQHQQQHGVEPLGPSTAQRVHGQHSGALRQGSHGPSVVELQTQLSALGYKDAQGNSLRADGNFGPGTRHALEDFQRSQGLTADGVAGSETLKKLHEMTQQREQAPSSQEQAPKPGQTTPSQQSGQIPQSQPSPSQPAQTPAQTPAILLNNPDHPDNPLYKEALKAVQKMDAQYGRTSDARSEQLAAALVVAARQNGLQHIENVIPSKDGTKVFAVEGDLKSPFKEMAEVKTAEALNTPIAKSTEAWNETVQKTQQPEQTQTPQRQQSTPSQDRPPPTMIV